MPHAGASQIHPHLQGMLGKGKYFGKMGRLSEVSRAYKKSTSRDYFDDYLNLHIALGLGIRYRTTGILVPIDAQKEHEFIVFGKSNLKDWIRAMYLVYRTYVEELSVYCFSSGMAWPTFVVSHSDIETDTKNPQNSSPSGAKHNDEEQDSLMFARMGGRGNCQSVESDVSSLELYTINHLSSDPYITFKALRTIIDKYDMLFEP